MIDPDRRGGARTFSSLVSVLLILLLGGCASSSIKYHAVGMEPPLCSGYQKGDKAALYWGAAWRADQKEVSEREAVAESVINDFFGSIDCISVLSVSRTINGRDVMMMSDAEILEGAPEEADRIFVIRLEELGPNLMIYLSPVLWATRNEVVFGFRSLNAGTGLLEADVSVHWSRGGPFTMLGAAGLDEDLSFALEALFREGSSP